MNLSIKNRFLCLSNPKSGSSTFRFLLDEFSDVTPNIMLGGAEEERRAELLPSIIDLIHLNAHESKRFIQESDLYLEWDLAYKFTTVRNPYRKMVSWYVFLQPDKDFNFPMFRCGKALDHAEYDPTTMYHHHFNDFLDWAYNNDMFLPNYEFFCCDWETKELLLDDVFKIEEINDGEFTQKFLEKTNISLPSPLPRMQPDYRTEDETTGLKFKGNAYDLYNENSINIIKEYFKTDLEKFNYEFGQ